jgi:hypothetical protein
MTYVLLMVFCVSGSCVEFKPEGDYVVFKDVSKCRELARAIRLRVQAQGVGNNGLCLLAVREPGAESES